MREVALKYGQTATIGDGTPFIIENGDLALHVLLPCSGEFFFVTEQLKIPVPSNGYLTVPVTPGTLRACVKRYEKGRLKGSFMLEPLEIVSADQTLTGYPELSALVKDNAFIKKAVKENKRSADEAVTSMEKTAKTLVHALAVAFFSYAYNDYKHNVQLNSRDLSAREFIAAMGYPDTDFTAAELAEIAKERHL